MNENLKPLALIVLLTVLSITGLAHTTKATPLTTHSPISIVGNNGFTSPSSGVTYGNGSLSNPYIIANWIIPVTGITDGIHIEQTNASFIIKNINIQGQRQSNGIFFLNVTNGVVNGATITDSIDGISMALSNATIESSHISNNSGNGIKIEDGEKINLFNNTLSQETLTGIDAEACVRCALNITRNIITSTLSGISLRDMNNSFIFENSIVSNQNNGIGIYRTTYSSIVLNNITTNSVGVNLVSSTSILVHHNNFLYNNIQALDNETGQNMWDVGYASGGNYWSDYQSVFNGVDNCHGPAQNICTRSDGIGDKPYTFANARDNYPLMNLFVESTIHDVAVATIIPSSGSVNASQILPITVIVANEGEATENFTLTLFYDRTMIGTQTVQSLNPATSQKVTMIWNTTGVPPGPHYLKAVESTVWGEIDIADNTLVTGPVMVKALQSAAPPPSRNPAQGTPSSYDFSAIGLATLLLFVLAIFAYRRRRRNR